MSNSRITRSTGHLAEPASTQKWAYERHRARVEEATATVDMEPPRIRPHVLRDAKRLQLQRERQALVSRENFILLKNLRDIMHRRGNKYCEILAKQKSECIRTR